MTVSDLHLVHLPDGVVPEVCVTCSDEGRLGRVLEPPAGEYLPAIVRTEAGVEEVDVTLVGPVAVGDFVLIHAGGALTIVAAPSAAEREALA